MIYLFNVPINKFVNLSSRILIASFRFSSVVKGLITSCCGSGGALLGMATAFSFGFFSIIDSVGLDRSSLVIALHVFFM
jgi:hypothetical protein